MRRLFLAFAAACVPVVLAAQFPVPIPSRNVNMVSGTGWPDGDPFLQRQNEGSVAASTRNPLHLLAGANDYRTVDLPGLPGGDVVGDAWLGLFKSVDGGSRWTSTLLPGYPQDTSAAGAASPLKGYGAGADPVVRAGTNGLFYYSGIVFDRTAEGFGKSAVFVARFIDNNNKEAGDPIVYLDAKLVSSNPGTAFIDKPWFATDIPRAGAQTCTFTTTQPNPTAANPNATITTQQSFPGGAAYVTYSVITGSGSDTRAQVYFSRSTDCGTTWSAPLQLSADADPVNQGSTLAIDPRNGVIYVAWRRFSADGTDDSLMVARSLDQGRKWDPPGRARRFPRGRKVGLQVEVHGKKFTQPAELTDLASLDQPTVEDRFRTNAYPSMTVDDQGRVYVAWSERGFAPLNTDPDDGDARILIATSANGASWSAPTAVDNSAQAGHQVMPAMTFAEGRLLVAWYDFQQDVSQVFRKYIDDTSAVVFGGRRHTVDVRAALATPAAQPAFGPSVQVSEYLFGSRPGTGPRPVEQLQFNPPNLKMFRLGTVPFFGDYIDLTASPAFVPAAGGGWTFNTAASSTPLYHVVWTDNRDVVPPIDGDWTNYTPPRAVLGQTSLADPSKTLPQCSPGREGMRNQNIYTARITGGLVAGSPGNSKPLDPNLQRTFVVFAQNATYLTTTYRLTIENQPADGRASFSQYPLPPFTVQSAPPLTTLEAVVPARSTIARTVYATSSDPHAQIRVSVKEITGVNGTLVPNGAQTTIVLNPDVFNPEISNPEISNPEISNPEISNPEISNAEVHNPEISNPEISNPEISNPEISNPEISNPEISNPEISNIQVANPDIANPEISNPEISNPEISNPEISNPEISNPEISNQSLTDTTWTITNHGNTTTAYSLKLVLTDPTLTIDPSAIVVQLVLRKVYTTPVAVNCQLGLHAHNVLLANILNPTFVDPSSADLSNPEISNPEISNATLWLAPGETGKITIRTFDKNIHDNITFNAAEQIVPVVVSQPVNTEDLGTPGAQPPMAFPSSPFLRFLQQPAAGSTNSTLGPVRVRVTDITGAPLPGVGPVTLNVYLLPNAASPVRTLASTTNETGIATFDIGTFALPGTYLMRASALVGEDDVFTWSDRFVLTEPAGETIVVSNTSDSGAGSLRQAILDANADGSTADTIAFNIPGAGPFVIAPASPLPEINQPVTIDATTQPGFAGTPIVALDGAGAGSPAVGLRVMGSNITVRGLAIGNFNGPGVQLGAVAVNARIQGNYIGLTPGGAAAANTTGIESYGGGNLIGGSTAAERNVISGNSGWAGLIQGIDVPPNLIMGNYIGTNPAGTAAVPNGGGLWLNVPTTVGGSNPGEGNVISGNATAGVALLNDDNASTIQGNYIGTNAAGTAAVPNTGPGISISDTEFSVIGGTTPGARNVISGNTGDGIRLMADASATTIQGNYIGLNAAGTAAIANGGSGVVIDATFGTQLGGSAVGSANVISGNLGNGVVLVDAASNTIQGNYIGLTAAGGADLGNKVNGIRVTGESYANSIGVPGAGNVISGNDVNGISIESGSYENVVRANIIGLDVTGTAAIGNGTRNEFFDLIGAGVRVAGTLNEIGRGTEGNVISGNGTGVSIPAEGVRNYVRGNLIGTTANGNSGRGNRFGVFTSAAYTEIGGTGIGEGNVISGNTVEGVAVTGDSATNILILGNRIGTDRDGFAALSNTFAGVSVRFGAVVTIGGDVAGSRNVISGNSNTGIAIETPGVVVRGNNIGTDAALTGPLGNGTGVRIAASGTLVDGNVIAFNTAAGVNATGAGNALVANTIFDNGGLGIDQGGDGVTSNDATETDAVQNFPILTLAQASGATVRLAGSLSTTPSAQFQISFYSNPVCDPSGHGEGQLPFASTTMNTNSDGILSFDFFVNGITLTPGHSVAAIARRMTTGDTSEFSPCVTVTPGSEELQVRSAVPGAIWDVRSAGLKSPARIRDESLLVALGLE